MAYQNQSGDRLKEITDKLEKGLQDLFSSGQYADYLKTMSKFYNYSANLLIGVKPQNEKSDI